MILQIESLDLYYGDAQALDGVSLSAKEGELIAIVGANGAGKTSLIRTIAGMLTPRAGHIRFRGNDITGLPSHRVCNLGIGQVAEGRQIFPSLTVEENYRSERCCRVRASRSGKGTRTSTRCFRDWLSGAGRLPEPCPAASSRCLRSAAASWAGRN